MSFCLGDNFLTEIDMNQSVPLILAFQIILALIIYRCLKPFSIRLEAMFKQQNPCSNHEIHVPFEHGFWLKSVYVSSLVNAK